MNHVRTARTDDDIGGRRTVQDAGVGDACVRRVVHDVVIVEIDPNRGIQAMTLRPRGSVGDSGDESVHHAGGRAGEHDAQKNFAQLSFLQFGHNR